MASVLVALSLRIAAGQGFGSSNGEAGLREVVLRPEAVAYELEGDNRTLDQRKEPFLKEPELSPRHVFRSVLQFGKDTNNATALIWDRGKRRLYLDINRNLDLTDDPGGIYNSPGGGFAQRFKNIVLPLKSAEGVLPAKIGLQLSADANGTWLHAYLTAGFLWEAKVSLEGEEWQVAVVDELFGPKGPAAAKFLLLRPWAARTNWVSLRDPVCGIVPFPKGLFWLGQAFRPEARVETGGETPVCKLAFTPEQPPLTELKLAGEFVSYAVLRDTNGYTVVLGKAAGTVKVPQGVYTVNTAWLKQGAAAAYRVGGKPVQVKATVGASLALGGPLTNWVKVERQGRKLAIDYQLKGAGGERYQLAREDRENPPQFVVYYGGKKVLADKFQYG